MLSAPSAAEIDLAFGTSFRFGSGCKDVTGKVICSQSSNVHSCRSLSALIYSLEVDNLGCKTLAYPGTCCVNGANGDASFCAFQGMRDEGQTRLEAIELHAGGNSMERCDSSKPSGSQLNFSRLDYACRDRPLFGDLDKQVDNLCMNHRVRSLPTLSVSHY